MILSEYLGTRTKGKSKALTQCEAKLIGLPWPLTAGWPKKYATHKIPDSIAMELSRTLSAYRNHKKLTKPEKKAANLKRKLDLNAKINADIPGFVEKVDLPKQRSSFKRIAPPTIKEKWLSNDEFNAKNNAFYLSREWHELRYKALTRHGATCQCCGATRANGVRLHVDHIKPRSKFPELQLDLENLQILCEDCNLGKSNKDSTDWRH